jgi:hypothetical protein
MLKTKLEHSEQIYIQFTRDAWQVTSRPEIVEKDFGGKSDIPISEMYSERWTTILTEALGCLNKQEQYRGRNQQPVTLKLKRGDQIRIMQVSPHLRIWTPIDLFENMASNLERGITRLQPVHEWVSRLSH